MKILKLVLAIFIFISISFLFFNFTFPNKQGKNINTCLVDSFQKSNLGYEEYCKKVGGVILENGVCNFYSIKSKVLNGDLNIDSELQECFKKYSNES